MSYIAYGKILLIRPRSSVDRVLASEAEDRSSSLRGGTKTALTAVFLFASICIIPRNLILGYNRLVYRINITLLIATMIVCAGCGVYISNENTFTATPDFITATLPPTVTLPATQISILRTSTARVAGEPTTSPIEGITTTQVNVRTETSTASETLGLIGQFAKVQIIGRDASGSWYRIVFAESATGYGWVRAEYVQVNASAEIPPVENVTGGGSYVSGLVIQKINVRNGPGTSYNSLGVLSPNDVVAITGKDPSGAWMQIEFTNAPDGKGWAASEFLQIDNPDILPIVGSVEKINNTPASATTLPTTIELLAIQDGDSMQAPLAKALFSPTGTRALQVTGEVSAPSGDTEDWIQFTSYSEIITIQMICSSDNLKVELWNNMILENDFLLTCGDKQFVTITPNDIYFLRLSETSSNEPHYTHYILTLEAIR